MNIAKGVKNQNGGLSFPAVKFPFLLPEAVEFVRPPEGGGDYAFQAKIAGEIVGFFREKVSGGNVRYLNGTLQSPAFGAEGKVWVAVFASREGGGRVEMVWSPPKHAATIGGDASTWSGGANGGGGTTPPRGPADGPGEMEDDIPF